MTYTELVTGLGTLARQNSETVEFEIVDTQGGKARTVRFTFQSKGTREQAIALLDGPGVSVVEDGPLGILIRLI